MCLSGNNVGSKFVKVARGWTSVGAPGGPTVHPMAWVGTRAAPKRPAFSGRFGLTVRGRGPSVGHGYKNVNGQVTVTTPMAGPTIGAVNVFDRITSTVTATIGPGSY